jgi:hypothetical protein
MNSDDSSAAKQWRPRLHTLLLFFLVLSLTIGYVGRPAYKWASRYWNSHPAANVEQQGVNVEPADDMPKITVEELRAALGPRIDSRNREIVIAPHSDDLPDNAPRESE